MKINNDININVQNVNLNNVKKIEKPQINYTENEKGLMLPDIRGNQVLLPDNKIYVVNGSKPLNFNEQNISTVLPESYRKIGLFSSEKDASIMLARRMYKNLNMTQYTDDDTGKRVIRGEKNNFNEQGVLDSREVMEIDLKKPYKATKIVEDYEHNTTTEIKYSQPLVQRKTITESITTLHKDGNGKVIKTEEYTQSPVRGVYDITETDAAGNKKILAKTTMNKDGYTVERHLTSLDGTQTEYKFTTDKQGNNKSLFCQITDAQGKVLSTIDRNYDKDGNITKSTVNGNKYTTERNGKEVTITNQTKGESVTITAEDFAATKETKDFLEKVAPGRNFSQQNVADTLFDQLPTDTLFTLHNNVTQIVPLKDDLDSAFVSTFDFLMCKTDNFVINHELGHSKDAVRVPEDANLKDKEVVKSLKRNVIADTTDFRTAYAEEKAAFIKEFPDYKEKLIGYFIFSPDSKPQRGRKETVAETNAINGLTPEEPATIAMRTIILQQYFPRSIAEITKLTNPIARAELIVNNQQNVQNEQQVEKQN